MSGTEPVRVGVDLGQGGCRAVARHGRSTGHAETPGFWTGDADARIADAVAGAVAGLGPLGPDATVLVGVGMTGLNGRPPATDALRARLRALGRPGRLRIADDSVTAYLGALGPVPGAVVAAGTGAVVLAADAAGRTARSDGWGADLGDRGSGHWIGRTAIRLALRDRDRAAPGRLADAVTAVWGPVETLPARWRADPPTPERIAGFATTVADLARAGDDDAGRIWRRAGELLAESVVGALFRVGLDATPVPVAGTGGVFRATDLVWSSFTAALRAAAPAAQPVPAAGDPLAGALALADGPPGPGPFPGLTVQIDFDAKAEHR